jgi:Flp pilus assembly protein CpaB
MAGAAALNAQTQELKAEVRTIFQRIQIIAVGQDQRLPSAQVNRMTSAFEGGDLANKNVTVALSPQDVQKLILAQAAGRIVLSLRPFGDTSTVDNLDYLDPFRAFGIKLPIVVGPPPAYREIRGGQVYATPF